MLKYLSPLHKATRQISVWFEDRMEGMGLISQEGHILSYLRSYSPCPISELVRVFGIKQSTMTSMLDRLEQRALIVRELNRDDRRSFMVALTGEGRTLANRVQKFVTEIEAKIGERVGPAELRGFQSTMEAIERATEVVLREREPSKPAGARRRRNVGRS